MAMESEATDRRTDIVVIGSGPGGEGAAMQACKEGMAVIVVERDPAVGGGCTHRGTIPAKALRQMVSTRVDYGGGAARQSVHPSLPAMLAEADTVIRKQVALRSSFYLRNGVEVLHGSARFVDPHTVWVIQDHGGVVRIRARYVVLAPGSVPNRPDDIDFSHPRVRDSDTILGLEMSPRTLAIYGAGAIGCEYASIFKAMGAKVNLVNAHDHLLGFLDDEIVDALTYHLRDQGVVIRQNETYEKVELHDDAVVLHLQSGKKIKADVLLWTLGRRGDVAALGLEAIGVEPGTGGFLAVDEFFRLPHHPHIYAVGDVTGQPCLASSAYDQGRFAGTHLVKGTVDRRLASDIPTGIYTLPEISSLGRTERELTEAKVPYEVGQAKFRDLARAQITGVTVGMLKILFHRETRRILGIHCFGYQASEIIHIGQAIMSQPGVANTLDYFVNTTFNYPTMAEAYRVAALNGLNRLW